MIFSIQNRKTCSEKNVNAHTHHVHPAKDASLRDAGITRIVPFLPSEPFLSEWKMPSVVAALQQRNHINRQHKPNYLANPKHQ